jgi:hypothetical protein
MHLIKLMKKYILFHPVSNFNTLRHQFESEKNAKNGRTPVKCCYWKHKSNNRNNNYSGLRNVLFKTTSKYKLTI